MIDFERIRLVLTCESSPEQYDAFLDEWQVGYLRMRHSWFSVSFPDAAGEQSHCVAIRSTCFLPFMEDQRG